MSKLLDVMQTKKTLFNFRGFIPQFALNGITSFKKWVYFELLKWDG
jgi:hypothetical protein